LEDKNMIHELKNENELLRQNISEIEYQMDNQLEDVKK